MSADNPDDEAGDGANGQSGVGSEEILRSIRGDAGQTPHD